MKVTFLITGLGRGGAETQLVRIACALKQRGNDVSVITLIAPESTELVGKLGESEIAVETLGLRSNTDVAKLPRLITSLRANRPDVLCSFLFHANVLAITAAKLVNIRRVVISVRNEAFGGGKNRLRLGRLLFRRADAVTINSTQNADRLIERGVLRRDLVQVIGNAIDVDAMQRDEMTRDAIRKSLEVGDHFMFLAVGRMHDAKDYRSLLRAFAKTEGALLFIAGKKDQEADLSELAIEVGLGNRVQFLGIRNDIPELLAACDALVLSSVTEGMPNAVLEAHAAARPVVATDVGAVRELVSNESGLISPPGDVDALASNLNQMIGFTDDERQVMGYAGRDQIRARFGIETIVDRWDAVLRG